jgi:hypothetical protein
VTSGPAGARPTPRRPAELLSTFEKIERHSRSTGCTLGGGFDPAADISITVNRWRTATPTSTTRSPTISTMAASSPAWSHDSSSASPSPTQTPAPM